MFSKSLLKEIVFSQHKKEKEIIQREVTIPKKISRAIIITGIRRCGKSTILKNQVANSLNVNFEDPRLEGFSVEDFFLLEELCDDLNKEALILDEVQNVVGWEKYVRIAVDKKRKIYVTGSNSSMLSRELGSKLTGRNTQIELFPFSFKEFLEFKKLKPGKKSFQQYFQKGGFPEYLKNNEDSYLQELVRDIVIRDVAVRRNIKNEKVLLNLAVYLLTNISKEFSFNKLAKTLNIKSVRTVIDYCEYLQDSYLVEFVSKHSFSLKKQIVNPKKVYGIDLGLIRANSRSFSKDEGRLLENLVFLHLRKKSKEVFYFKEDELECDFVVGRKVFQVCFNLNSENMKREVEGLIFASKKLDVDELTILTYDQEDKIVKDGKVVWVKPVFKWLLE